MAPITHHERTALFGNRDKRPQVAVARRAPSGPPYTADGWYGYYDSSNRFPGSSTYSFTFTRNCTASRPSTMRWS